MIDWSALELRVLAHNRRHFGTTTGRITSKVPSFKELPMNVNPDTNPADDLSPTERELSQLLFAHYHSNPRPGGTSRLTNDIARNLRGDEGCILKIATCLAKMVAPEHADKIGEVAGFYITPARPSGSISDLLQSMFGGDEPESREDTLIGSDIMNPLTSKPNPLVIWAKAYDLLRGHYSNVTFDHEYAEVADLTNHPGIHGDGINIVSVNGAILQVLMDNNLMHYDYYHWLATDQDEDGWVYSN